jgi:hypothetical protein
MVTSILFPDRMAEYSGFDDYFQSRRKWFYGLLAVIFLVDLIDTAIKGAGHFRSLGIEYPIRQASLAILAIVGAVVANRTYQAVFVSVALIYEIVWILRMFEIMG